MIMDYTTIYFDYNIYSINKDNLKKIMFDNGLVFINNKVKNYTWIELLEIFKYFKADDKIIENKDLLNRNGLTGLWENKNEAVKVVIFDEVLGKNDCLPVFMIYKRNELSNELNNELSLFYKKFIGTCINLGCEIGKVVETENGTELIFKKKINVKFNDILDDDEKNKKILEELFMNKVNLFPGQYNSTFVEKWNECIKKYTNYTMKDFIKELEEKNTKRLNDEKNTKRLNDENNKNRLNDEDNKTRLNVEDNKNSESNSNLNIHVPSIKPFIHSKSEIISPSLTFSKIDDNKINELKNKKKLVFKINRTKN